ncbi:MAG: A/G-specific adenine glycosylase [Acidimicrobiales bacterium]
MPPGFADAVLAWGEPRLRDLPWRRTRDPWAILVSEVMLQQTQVPRVVPKYLAFLEAFPTPAACAAVPLGEVLRHWQGLGYPRRARNLHATAIAVTERGGFPESLDELLALPGVGPYTARAIRAFAFEAEAAVVDTNIARVYARVVGRTLRPREVQAIADAAAPVGEWWAWNQTIMELGAVLCRPGSPRCDECPVASTCAWRGSEVPDPAVGSAGVSVRQARFDGSDRQARGALLRAAGTGAVTVGALATVSGRDTEHARRLADALVAEGLLVREAEGTYRLP